MTDVPPARFEMETNLVRLIPLAPFLQPCTIIASTAEIRCTRAAGSVVFSGPPAEFHSYAPWFVTGFQLWHKDRRYRFSQWHPVIVGAVASIVIEDQATDVAVSVVGDDALSRLVTGSPPAGLKVKPPPSFARSAAWAIAAVYAFVTGLMLVIAETSGGSLLPLLTLLPIVFGVCAVLIVVCWKIMEYSGLQDVRTSVATVGRSDAGPASRSDR